MKRKTLFHFCIDILLVTGSFLFIIWLKPTSIRHYLPAYDVPFAGFLILWILSSLIFGKYSSIAEKKFLKILDIIIRSNTLVTAISASMIFIFDRFHYSRKVVFGTLILATVAEVIYAYLIYIRRKQKTETDSPLGSAPISTRIDYTIKEELKIDQWDVIGEDQQVKKLLKERYLKNIPGLYNWIDTTLSLERISKDNAVILYSHHIYNIEFYDPDTLELLINLYPANDLRHVNSYFRTVWKGLKPGGYYLICCKTNSVIKKSYKEKLSPGISQTAYFFHFCFHRVMPKLPVFSQIYYSITKGINRAFSFTEILGRLYYCGFSAVSSKIIGGFQFFIVKKTGHPITGQTPTYGPLISLNRVGKGGKPIKVLKMRTMHPYSEFLQDYVYQRNNLEKGGKFKNDFRVTTSGKIMRKLWLDELPMVLNLIRGELKIVGVRPISKHYLDLYSEELQELRLTVKPGLIPPFYADMPKTIEEIQASEIKYIKAYKKNKIFTDLRYFYRAIVNILFRKARSA